jgi:hypothetical protein
MYAMVDHRLADKKLPSRPPSPFVHVKSLVSTTFTVVSTHQSALGPRGGLWPPPFCNPYGKPVPWQWEHKADDETISINLRIKSSSYPFPTLIRVGTTCLKIRQLLLPHVNPS